MRTIGVVLDFLPDELADLRHVPEPVLEIWRRDPDNFLGWSEIWGTALTQIEARYSFDEGV